MGGAGMLGDDTSGTFRRQLRRLNGARAVAVTTLLVSLIAIESLFGPTHGLRPLYLIAVAAYTSILLWAVLDRWLADRPVFAALQVAADLLLVAALVTATGGGLSPLTFLFALPVMMAAALLGLRGGMLTASLGWLLFAGLLAIDAWRLPPEKLPPGHVLYSAVSHLVGFITLGALGGLLADRLRSTSHALERQQGDFDALRALHADIVASISAGLVTTRTDGTITFANRAATEILGLPAERLLGLGAADFFRLPPDFLRHEGSAPRAGQRNRFELAWQRGDGDSLQLGMTISVLRGASATPAGWVIAFQDLTELASLEQQVRMRERMAALGEMAAGMAHELRNPLTAITGCVQMLGRDDERKNTSDRRSLADVAVRESHRLNRIIGDFLEFARPGPLRPRPIELGPLMEEMARLLSKSPDILPQHRVELSVEPGGVWGLVDPDRIRQVFWNLASNGLKAMRDGGRLEIGVRRHVAGQVLLWFRDEGHGMDAAALERYFQPFHSGFHEGAGLGSAIVYRIAQEHGGSVEVQSRPGKGTAIRLLLPAAAPVAAAEPAPLGDAVPARDPRSAQPVAEPVGAA